MKPPLGCLTDHVTPGKLEELLPQTAINVTQHCRSLIAPSLAETDRLTCGSHRENEHYSALSGLIRLVRSLECFIEITPDFLGPFMND